MICEAWEGLTVDGKFPLLERLPGARGRCLFLTVRQGINTAGIRLIVADRAEQDGYLASWDAAKNLSHPSLSQLMETGRSSVRGSELAYVVMEKPDAFLSEFIPSRALSPARAKGILEPIVDALSFVHEKGMVHGRVKPSSIIQFGEQWKLASDEMESGTAAGLMRELDSYDAPETGKGALSPAADVWSLGIITIEAFAQKNATWDRSARGNLGVPDWLPKPFYEIARGCLRWDPAQRISLKEIKALLERSTSLSELEAEKPKRDVVDVKSGAFVAPPAAAARPHEPAPPVEARANERKRQEEKPAPVRARVEEEEEEYEDDYDDEYGEGEDRDELLPRSRRFGPLEEERRGVGRVLFICIVLLVAVAAVLATRGYFNEYWTLAESRLAPLIGKSSPASQAPVAEEPSKTATTTPDQTPPQTQPEAAPPVAPPESQSANSGESTAENQQPNQQPSETPSAPAAPSAADEGQPLTPTPSVQPEPQKPAKSARSAKQSREAAPAPRVANARGAIATRVLPNVAEGARQGMRRPVDVEVQVSVNEHGSVSDANCLTQGSGNYFARISVQAAQGWKFEPPISDGQPQPSSWLLRFHFDRSHVEVTASEAR